MSTTEVRTDASATSSVARVDMKLEVVVIPVSDVDRAKQLYAGLGWRLDADVASGDHFRLIEFTPKGTGCSIQFGKNLTPAAPGSAQALHLIVSDIEAAREELVAHGVDASEVFHCSEGYACRFPATTHRSVARIPSVAPTGSFLTFSDPDGNGWLLQEVATRFPGRVEGETTRRVLVPGLHRIDDVRSPARPCTPRPTQPPPRRPTSRPRSRRRTSWSPAIRRRPGTDDTGPRSRRTRQ